MSVCQDSNENDFVGLQKADDAAASVSSSSSVSLTAASSSMSTSSESSKTKNLWWIHGNGYDLEDFVKSHPGGVEAILLGKGRDCTALVESYHAFSGDRVWKTLEKYRAPNEDESDGETEKIEQRGGRVKDFFYEVLKERVTKVLRSKGIDPVKDRGASKTRIAYYLVVLASWLYTGYLHCSVSFKQLRLPRKIAVNIFIFEMKAGNSTSSSISIPSCKSQ